MLNLIELAMWTGAFCAIVGAIGFYIEHVEKRNNR